MTAICKHGHLLTPENLGTQESGSRFCKECARIRSRESMSRLYKRRRKEKMIECAEVIDKLFLQQLGQMRAEGLPKEDVEPFYNHMKTWSLIKKDARL